MDMDLFGDRIGGALDLDLMEHQGDRPTSPVARGLTAEIEGNPNLDSLGLVDADEINVKRFDTVGVPLEIAHEGACLYGALQFDDPSAVADNGFEGLTLGGEINALFSVPVQNGGDEPLATESAGLAGTCGGAGYDFERIAHDCSFSASHTF
jgi:hypothetical protein